MHNWRSKSKFLVKAGMALSLTLLFGCSQQDGSAGDTQGTHTPPASGVAPSPPEGTAPPDRQETDEETTKTADSFPYRAEIVATGLNVPWEMAFAPDGRILFTERPGKLRVIENGEVRAAALLELPAPFVSRGEGGLLGLALDPGFADNGFAYVYHSYRSGDGVQNRVLRLKIGENVAEIDKVLLDGIPGDTNHNGGRIKFGPDGLLYITTGERYEPELAQNAGSLGGKILRIAPDGSIPPDNPWTGSPVYSIGHRNPQGLAWQPETGVLYSSEHGQSAHDEINLIEPGANYGWPLVEGDETESEDAGDLTPPLLHSGEETWAP